MGFLEKSCPGRAKEGMPRINSTEGNAVGIGALWQGLKLECSMVAGQLSGERSAAANPKSGDLKLLEHGTF